GFLHSEATTNEKMLAFQNQRVIRICNYDHLQTQTWKADIESVRQKRKEWNDRSLASMREALKGKRCIADLLSEAYRIPARKAPTNRAGAVVAHACGGCPYCRANGHEPYITPMPRPRPSWQGVNFPVKQELERLFAGEKVLAIFYDSNQPGPETEETLLSLFVWLNGQGVRNIVAPQKILAKLRLMFRGDMESISFFFKELEPLLMPPVPTVVFHAASEAVPLTYMRVTSASPHRVLLLPMGAADPASSHRRLFDSFNGRRFRF